MTTSEALRQIGAVATQAADELDAHESRHSADAAALTAATQAIADQAVLIADLRRQLADSQIPAKPPMLPRPAKGNGIYYLEDLRLGIRDALQHVRKLGGGILSCDTGTYEDAGFGGEGNACMFVPPGVTLLGRGSAHTFFRVKPHSMTAAERAKIPTTAPQTNPLKVMQVHKDGSPLWDVKVEGFTVLGTDQGGANYTGILFAYNPRLKVRDVVGKANRGSLNSPPGETGTFSLLQCPDAEFWNSGTDGLDDETGKKVSGAGFAINSSPRVKLRDCFGIRSGHSHGLAAWNSPDGQTWGFVSTDNGIALGSDTNGHTGAGLNHEQSGGWVHRGPVLGGNTLADIRHYSNVGDTKALTVEGLVKRDGKPFTVRLAKNQTSRPVLVNCPAPFFT